MSDLPASYALNRRGFLKLSAVGSVGLLIGLRGAAARPGPESVALHPLIRIGADGTVTVYAQNPEMGQGVKTSLPMIVAEELDVDWSSIAIEQADWNTALKRQFSGGSLSIRLNFEAMRKAGASAREMLLAAAARRWQTAVTDLSTASGYVIDEHGDRRLSYGELALAAASEAMPDAPRLKPASAFRLIGTSVADVDIDDIISGRQLYSIDLKLPGMLYASVARCPVSDGQPLSFNAEKARRVPGVVDIVVLKNTDYGGRIVLPNSPNFVSGVAVVASDTWAAMTAAKLLQVEWKLPAARDDSAALLQSFDADDDTDPLSVRADGNVAVAQAAASTSVDVKYRLPFLAHVPMEPMNCTASVHADRAEIWAPTQNPSLAAEAVAAALGMPATDITIHVMRSGGAFGRRFYADFVVDTAILSRKLGKPVKIVWSREDDVRHDYFRPASLQHVRAGTDRAGKISFWHHRVVSHPREIFLERDGSPEEISNYEFPAAFVPNLKFEYAAVPARIPLGQWRAVEHSSNVFVVASVIDELAHANGSDPLEFLLALIGDKQFVEVREDFRFDASRLRAVVESAAQQAQWHKPLPPGKGRGIAASYNQGAWVAEVAEVSCTKDTVSVDRIVAAVDCGLVVNPSAAVKQVQGAIIEGLSATLFGEITVKDGVVQQSNFHDYRICRMHHVPEIAVHFIDSAEAPRGLGEPPLPPVAPAVCNAIFSACGTRVRQLPLARQFSVA